MNNNDIYEYRLDELIKLMKRSRNSSALRERNSINAESAYVIDIAGSAFRDYQSVIAEPANAGQSISSNVFS